MLATITPPPSKKVWIFPGTGGTLRKRGKYQRFIIACMAQQACSSITKRVLAKQMAKRFGMSLRNAYTHTYMELNDSLIPGGIVEQDGAVPATRGPRIFQVNGVPCFRLSGLGMLLACCLEEIDINERMALFRQYIDSDRSWRQDSRKGELLSHLEAYPEFTLELLKHGAAQYLEGKIDHPLSILPTRRRQNPTAASSSTA
ncbi:hypothetical protein NTE_03343 [Candidatus Nitrososphaera evergladensis SR1]|jgi:hypothetical protein|uniref:Uncharacterized protein n=2 Tax=Nitrososphaera TaxID=497726 RepID=A0A075MXN4_9ARCH|nr:hypothetical protein NTE_03343 [Candidatus Nitrososphaera evergladensis SR1]